MCGMPRQHARMFVRLNPDGGVVDVELVVQGVRDAAQEIVAGLSVRHERGG